MEMRNKRIMITGGAGFIGSHLVDLLAENNQLHIVDNFSTGSRENLLHLSNHPSIAVHEADIRDQAAMETLMRGVQVVYHLAVQCVRLSLRQPHLVHEVCATGTLNILQAALHNDVERFIYVSSSEVYGDTPQSPISENAPLQPTTIYAAAKLAGEWYSKAFYDTHDLPVLIVRPFNSYGPRSHFEGVYGEVIPRFVIRAMNGLSPVIFGDGKQTRDFTFVTETAKGILLASECDDLVGDAVNIGYGREISIRELADLVLSVTGNTDLDPEHIQSRPGDTPRLLADNRKAETLLRFKPAVALRDGLQQYIHWLRMTGKDPAQLLVKIENKNW